MPNEDGPGAQGSRRVAPSSKVRAFVVRRSARSSASPTGSSTTGPGPVCSGLRSLTRVEAEPNAATRTTTCST